MEIRMPERFSLSVQTKDVSCELWSVFVIPGAPTRWMGLIQRLDPEVIPPCS